MARVFNFMIKYCIQFNNAGDGKIHRIKRNSAHEAFVDLIEILDNVSNANIQAWIERK